MVEETTAGTTGATPVSGAMPEKVSDVEVSVTGATPAPRIVESPATGDAALGEAGKAILRDARRAAREADDRAKAAEARLAQIQEAGQSDHEKALNQVRRESAAERDTFWKTGIRHAHVQGALRAAGVTNEELLDQATASRHFRDLKVDTETQKVDGLAEAVEAYRQAVPEAFATRAQPGPGGSWDGAAGGRNASDVTPGVARLEYAYANPDK